MIATFGDNLLFGTYHYRETVSPWFRGIFMFSPRASLMEGAPFLFQLHAASVWLLYAVWPFSRLVQMRSIPSLLPAAQLDLYRSRNPRAALAYERSRRAAADERAAR